MKSEKAEGRDLVQNDKTVKELVIPNEARNLMVAERGNKPRDNKR